MVRGVYTHLNDMLASQYQSTDWIQHTTNQSSIHWGNVLALGTMYEKTSLETSLNEGRNSCPGQDWSRMKFSQFFYGAKRMVMLLF